MKEFYDWTEAADAGLHTRTQWKALGRVVLRDAEIDGIYDGRKRYGTAGHGPFDLFDKSKTKLKRNVIQIDPTEIDLLAAIFTATRTAKRYRDAAHRCYQSGCHAMAGQMRKKKEACYMLKDRGIVAAFRSGRITAIGSLGNLTIYRGEGYCYHSLLRPAGFLSQMTGDQTLKVEAKPKLKEPRLKDALHTLGLLPDDYAGFDRIPFPLRLRYCRFEDDQDDEWEEAL